VPHAVRFAVTSSHQDLFGYELTSLTAHWPYLDFPLRTFGPDDDVVTAAADEVPERLGVLDRGAFGGTDADSAFEVDMGSGHIVR